MTTDREGGIVNNEGQVHSKEVQCDSTEAVASLYMYAENSRATIKKFKKVRAFDRRDEKSDQMLN